MIDPNKTYMYVHVTHIGSGGSLVNRTQLADIVKVILSRVLHVLIRHEL